jgi:hypothetical protein
VTGEAISCLCAVLTHTNTYTDLPAFVTLIINNKSCNNILAKRIYDYFLLCGKARRKETTGKTKLDSCERDKVGWSGSE